MTLTLTLTLALTLTRCVSYGCFTGALPNTSEGCANTQQLMLRSLFYAGLLGYLLRSYSVTYV